MDRKSTRKLWAEHIDRGGAQSVSARKAVPIRTVQFNGLVLRIDSSLRGSGFAVLDYQPNGKACVVETATLRLEPALSPIECLGAIGFFVCSLLILDSGVRSKGIEVR